jgi:hypothetical protein
MATYTYYTRLTLIHPKDIGKLDPSLGKIIAETATTGKFIINEITWDSAVNPNKDTTIAVSTTGELKIFEPMGMRMLDYIRFAALECGIENHLSAAFLLEIEILAETLPDNKEFRYIWPIMFLATEVKSSVNEKGTEYNIKFVHHSHHSQTDMVQPLKETLTIDGVSKVEDYFKEFGRRLELMEFKYAEAGQKAGPGGAPGGDHPASSCPYHDEYHFILDPRINDYTLTNKEGADPGVKGSWTNYLPFTTNKFNVSARSGTTIISQAQRILASTKESSNLYLEEYGRLPGAGKSGSQSSSANKEELKKAMGKIYNFFRIETHTVYKEFDYVRGRYAVKHIFIIWLAMQPNLYQYPDELDELNKEENKGKVEQKLKAYVQEGLLRKAYYYTYTGLNTEILKCNLSLNQAYYLPSFPVVWTERGSTGPGKMKPYNFSREIQPWARTAADENDRKALLQNQAEARRLSQLAASEKDKSKKEALIKQQKAKEAAVEDIRNKINASGKNTATNKNQLTNRADLLKSYSNLYIEDVDYQSGLQAAAAATPTLRPRMEPDTPVSQLDTKKDENENLMDKIFSVQLAARDLMELEIEIRGDPYWLGQPNMILCGQSNLDKLDLPPALKAELEKKIPEIDPDFSSRNSSWGNYGNAKFYKGGNMFYFNAQLPVNDFGEDDLMKFNQIDQILGIYMVITTKNEFKNGQWIQILKTVRDLTIPSKFIPRASIGETTFEDYVKEAASDPNRALDSFNQNRSDQIDQRNQEATSQGFANTGGGAATGNPIIARGTQQGNPNIRPGSLRDRAAQANAARAAAAKEKLDTGLKTNPAPDCDAPVANAVNLTNRPPPINALSASTFEVLVPLSKQQAYSAAKQQFYDQVNAFFKHLDPLNIQAYKDAGVVNYVPYKGETLASLVIQRSGSGGLEDWKRNNTNPGPWSINNPGGLNFDSSTGTYPSFKTFYDGLLAVNSYYNYGDGVGSNGKQGSDRFLLPADNTINELEYIQLKSKGSKQ